MIERGDFHLKFECGDICVIKKVDGYVYSYEHTLTMSLNVGKVVRIEIVDYDAGEGKLPYRVKSLDGSDFKYYSEKRYDDLWLPEEALEIASKYALYDDANLEEIKTDVLL